jgi:predicted DsbA family dithiol-disulfide isomerase
MKTVKVQHFSDILCVWAYVSQARIDELCRLHGDEVQLDYHFVDVFGDVPGRLRDRWSEKGGLEAYAQHVGEVVSNFEHVELSDDVWRRVAPNSSTACHHFLHAVELANHEADLARAAWALRVAFFAQARDVSLRATQLELAEELCLNIVGIERELDNGAAVARVSRDLRKAKEQAITVSPTLVFNEGRQMLKGNVSFRAIEANVNELLSEHPLGQSWC